MTLSQLIRELVEWQAAGYGKYQVHLVASRDVRVVLESTNVTNALPKPCSACEKPWGESMDGSDDHVVELRAKDAP